MLNTLFRAKYLWQIFTETVQVTENSTSMLSVSMCSSKPVSGDRNWSNQGIWIPYLSALFIFKKIPNTHGCCKCGETGTGKNSKSSKPFPGRYDPFWSSKFQDWVVQSKEIPAHVYGFLTVEQRKRKTRNNLTPARGNVTDVTAQPAYELSMQLLGDLYVLAKKNFQNLSLREKSSSLATASVGPLRVRERTAHTAHVWACTLRSHWIPERRTQQWPQGGSVGVKGRLSPFILHSYVLQWKDAYTSPECISTWVEILFSKCNFGIKLLSKLD